MLVIIQLNRAKWLLRYSLTGHFFPISWNLFLVMCRVGCMYVHTRDCVRTHTHSCFTPGHHTAGPRVSESGSTWNRLCLLVLTCRPPSTPVVFITCGRGVSQRWKRTWRKKRWRHRWEGKARVSLWGEEEHCPCIHAASSSLCLAHDDCSLHLSQMCACS